MAATLEIREDGYVVLVTIADPWQVSQFPPLYQMDRDHRDKFQQSHPGEKVDLVVDMLHASNPAQGFLTARQTPSMSHPTAGYILIVGANTLMRTMSEAVARIARFKRVQFFDTLEQAFEFSKNMRMKAEKRRSRTG